jgi:hypothetical protein
MRNVIHSSVFPCRSNPRLVSSPDQPATCTKCKRLVREWTNMLAAEKRIAKRMGIDLSRVRFMGVGGDSALTRAIERGNRIGRGGR